MALEILVNTGSSNGLLPDGTKLLSDTYSGLDLYQEFQAKNNVLMMMLVYDGSSINVDKPGAYDAQIVTFMGPTWGPPGSMNLAIRGTPSLSPYGVARPQWVNYIESTVPLFSVRNC